MTLLNLTSEKEPDTDGIKLYFHFLFLLLNTKCNSKIYYSFSLVQLTKFKVAFLQYFIIKIMIFFVHDLETLDFNSGAK